MNPRPALAATEPRKYPKGESVRLDGVNIALIKAMGGKRGYDPISPDQYEWQAADGQPDLHRVWSCMLKLTISVGKKSPYAVMDDGRPARLKDVAKMLDMDEGQLSNIWKFGVSAGLWHRGARGELYVNMTVKPAEITEANKRRKVERTLNLSTRDLLIIQAWPKELRDSFYMAWEAAQKRNRDYLASKLAEARASCGLSDDSIRESFGLPKKCSRLMQDAQVAEYKDNIVNPGLSVQENPVHSTPVECTPGEETGESLSVRGCLSILTTEKYQRSSPAAAALWSKAEVDVLARELALDAAAAALLLTRARANTPTVTIDELVELATSVVGQTKLNRVGFLCTVVPQKAAGAPLDAARERIQHRKGAAARSAALAASQAVELANMELDNARTLRKHVLAPTAWDVANPPTQDELVLMISTLQNSPAATGEERAWANAHTGLIE